MERFSYPGIVGLAPMAGISNKAFRTVCRLWGAQFSFSEMISAESVLLDLDVVDEMLPFEEENSAVQLYGSDPKKLALAAKKVQHRASWIDLNAACPVKKVIKKNAGAALLKDLERLRDIVVAMKNACEKPITVKIRIGFEKNELEKIMDVLVSAGVDGVEVHGRTAVQMYSGKAQWNLNLERWNVPTAISGDLYTVEDIRRALEISKASAALVARGALRKPWIFHEFFHTKAPTVEQIRDMFLFHARLLKEREGEKSFYKLRQFVAGYTHGFFGGREFRERFMKLEGFDAIESAIREFFNRFLMSVGENTVRDRTNA
ncbi:dihydrouridine synthase [Pseudothermotoga hypogea DSM 11164 = NBRC 106472]|uniref:tRNA-dihydrouridine synthase n=1 Tax=Pseudothermotoga hypogea DSM 11164 = NBRC 106472 TaxID=1123384 RepID=A0A0X1KQP5_9THEM|nr:tRNA-dihydrouridine synthase [Pseudothermotoga hypogea]AJC73627.1 dihydrouridine synthase [Pseudothermotoga hypogea DSM 11164 = NBRC 106472]